MHAYRSHTCAELNKSNVGDTVRLSGWVHRVRDHGGILFIDLRDHYGVTQVLCDPDSPVFAEVEKVRSEWCIRIDGNVKARDADLVNPKLPTGEVEVFVRDIEVLGASEELPLMVFGDQEYPEETRLKYRYLDLRREVMQKNMTMRSDVVASMRRRMWDQNFREYQTPIITASSPEGARDFLVPSRLHPGKFYALPQAPQQFKQLIMMSGYDKYFQIAPCFRDEDPRADRSPTDFYQLDLEMSFVEQQDVFDTIQPVLTGIFEEFGGGRKVDQDWPQISYKDAAKWYGTDKPDLRNPIKMQDVSEHFRGSGFAIFASLLENEGTEVRAIPAPTGGGRKFCDRMNKFAQGEGLPGMGYIFWREKTADAVAQELGITVKEAQAKLKSGEVEGGMEAAGPLAKNIGPERTEAIRQQLGLGIGDAAFFLGGKPKAFEKVAGKARDVIGQRQGGQRVDLAEAEGLAGIEGLEEHRRKPVVGEGLAVHLLAAELAFPDALAATPDRAAVGNALAAREFRPFDEILDIFAVILEVDPTLQIGDRLHVIGLRAVIGIDIVGVLADDRANHVDRVDAEIVRRFLDLRDKPLVALQQSKNFLVLAVESGLQRLGAVFRCAGNGGLFDIPIAGLDHGQGGCRNGSP